MTADPLIAERLRTALRGFARPVAIITACHAGERFAMVATAVSELSLAPPSMLACVNKSASIHLPMEAGTPFCINILHRQQQDIARNCSSAKGEARFASGDWQKSPGGLPYLRGAQANILCENVDRFAFGTHQVFVGRVVEAIAHAGTDPLLYANGAYTSLPIHPGVSPTRNEP